ILSIGLGASGQIQNFSNDLNDADGDAQKISDLLDQYSGEAFNLQVNNYSSVSKNSDSFAWSVGILAATDVTTMVHGNGSANGAPVEVSGRGYGGLLLGAAKAYKTDIGTVDIGVGLKYITQTSFEGPLYIADLQSNDAMTTLEDKYKKEASGFGLDLGLTYKPFESSIWHPAFGLSVLNIGSMNMDDNFGGQPTTVNIGASITPEVSFLEKLVLAIDYVDLFNENSVRVYTFNETDDSATYIDYEDNDPIKRLRLGAGFGLINSKYFSTQLNIGLYQGAYTAGLDMEIAIIKLNFATYEEQIGTRSVDIPDRRYMAQIGIGW
ncbi:MAG: conjugal transfer protein TraF, partial [Sulfurimonas sp.]|nr:conjugal transfer protein TraF [Sulfurimonas sp.]